MTVVNFIYMRVYILMILLMANCTQPNKTEEIFDAPFFEIAFMPDVHFHDLFANFETDSFEGLPVTWKGEEKMAVIRTMEAQLNSTRLFNENYFAFIAALEDIAIRGIKYVALPGDFSDDGQPAHVRGLSDILNKYRDQYGISFFLTPGNHDPTRPFATESGKRDYLGEEGMRQPVFSRNHPMCLKTNQSTRNSNGNIYPESHEVTCTDDVKEMGYSGLYDLLGDHGLLSQENYLYYETPFSIPDGSDDYHLLPENRMYEVCHEGSGGEYRLPHYSHCFEVPDMSYLVEPIDGIWLLALDTNVYVPRAIDDQTTTEIGDNFYGSGNAGYNQVLTHKKHLLPWMDDIARRANEQEKMLISFSHFPATDFYNGAGPLIEEVWGENEFQMVRMPKPEATSAVASTGVRLHVAGHMHMNGLEIVKDEQTGNVLTNIQVPSLAAYVPAYKIMRTFSDLGQIEIETVVLNEVTDFDTLFPLYINEWNYLNSIDYDHIWDRDILHSKTYLEFTDWHIRELSRLRFLPGEWPEDLRELLKNSTGKHFLVASFLPVEVWHNLTWDIIRKKIDDASDQLDGYDENHNLFQNAIQKSMEAAENSGFTLQEFENWNGEILSRDFYRIRNAGELGLLHIPDSRINQYSLITKYLRKHFKFEDTNYNGSHYQSLYVVFEIMTLFSNRIPSKHVMINLDNGSVELVNK